MTDQPYNRSTNRPTNKQTWGRIGKLHTCDNLVLDGEDANLCGQSLHNLLLPNQHTLGNDDDIVMIMLMELMIIDNCWCWLGW